MRWKSFILQIGVMTGVMVGVWSFVSGLLLGLMGFIDPATFGPEQAFDPLPGLLVTCLLNAVVVAWFVTRTRLKGFGLAAVVFLVVFGVMFFMTQTETVYFNEAIQMPRQIVFSTIITGVFVGAAASWLACRNKRKMEAGVPDESEHGSTPSRPWHGFLKGSVLSLMYLAFYFLFGYFIAWQFSALRSYYSGTTDILPFFIHMRNVIAADPGLVPFQILRGYLWAGIAFAIATNTGIARKWERRILVGCALSVGLATPLLIPNPYMPAAVRLGHFFELLIENFALGFIAAGLFKPKPLDPSTGMRD